MTTPRCNIPSATLPPCDLEWGHDGDQHSNDGDGFLARAYDDDHHLRQQMVRAHPFGSKAAEIPATLVFTPQPNTDGERLTCVICDHGHEDYGMPPEWLVTMLTPTATIMRGLHEACWRRHARSRHGH